MVLVNSPSPKRDDIKLNSQIKKLREPNTSYKSSRGSTVKSTKSTGASKIRPKLNGSRSESGSIERLTEGDKKIVGSKHLIPEDNINVVVRVRPLSNKEIKYGDDSSLKLPGDGQIQIENPISSGSEKKNKLFSYNVVFEPSASQEDVLQHSGIKKLIEMAVEGFNCTCFCYGQTGSGKTHTLTGPPGLFDGPIDSYSEDHGLVFRSFVYLFKTLQERKEFNFVLKSSFLEIYNEKVIDLLNPGSSRKSLAVRWSKKIRGFFVENLFTVECQELDDLMAVLEEGMRNRSVGTHNMNEHSSRSHTILTVHITSEQQMDNGVFITKQGKINFVDLAGSEMTKKTQSEGKTLEEANNINKSLMVLGYCIASLSDGKKKLGHIPYRDSNLTKLLADSLAGNGVSLMIACVSSARSNTSETLNTLRYAARAKKIRTKPIIVMDPREALILSLKREVGALQTENDHLRTALHIGNETINPQRLNELNEKYQQQQLNLAQVDIDKLAELDNNELSELLRSYINENEALRRENAELYTTRDHIFRDQELVCRENERLLKKLEDVNSVCCRSPIIPARPVYSDTILSSSQHDDLPSSMNIWTNPNDDASRNGVGVSLTKLSKNNIQIPSKVLKELDKRIVGSFSNIAETYKDHRRNKSWDNSHGLMDNNGERISPPTDSSQMKKPTLRRTSTVPEEMTTKYMNTFKPIVRRNSQSIDGTPDSFRSGSLNEGQSAPDTGDSISFTTPFPIISRSSSPFTTIDDYLKKNNNTESRIEDEQFPVFHS